ncbi:hypothetical protein [Deinococcus aluminii]|uniref:Uncharacterized protein n=1 Tax=Deinococcus aluminii TaxID=1656885 RepID=A0ABP9XFI5_9DEIO
MPPFSYQRQTLLKMIVRLMDTGHLNVVFDTPEELNARLRQWADLARQNAPLQGNRCLSYGHAAARPGKSLLIHGPYDRMWLTLAVQIPGRHWSDRDQAHVIPVRSYATVLSVLQAGPHYNLLSPEDVHEIEELNRTNIRRLA